MKVPLTNRPNIAIATLAFCLVCSVFLIGAVSAQSPYPVRCLCPFNQSNNAIPAYCLCPFSQENVTYPVSCLCPFSKSNASSPSCCSCPLGSSCTQTSRLHTQYLTPEFSTNITSGIAPLTVQFSDRSTGNPNHWLWDFGDGATSILQNPVHIYKNPGSYHVSLAITRAYGSSITSVAESRSITKSNFITVTGTQPGEINQESTFDADDSALLELRKEKITKFIASTSTSTAPFSRIRR